MDEHTVKRYDQELGELTTIVLQMGGLVQDQIEKAMKALRHEDIEQCRDVIARDHMVNFMDVQADEKIVNLLALRQPMGRDLRQIIALGKTVTDLERVGDEAERIGDHAKNISEYVIFLVKGKDVRHVSAESLDERVLDDG